MKIDHRIIYDSIAHFEEAHFEEYAHVLKDCTFREFEIRLMALQSAIDVSALLRYAVVSFKNKNKLTRMHMHYIRLVGNMERQAVLDGVWYTNEDRFDGCIKDYVR